MVGLVTFVTNLVRSVTSTCFRSSFGDMRIFSAPMPPGSSGGVPGHSSITCGLSAATTAQAMHNHAAIESVLVCGPLISPEQAGDLLKHTRPNYPNHQPCRPPSHHRCQPS